MNERPRSMLDLDREVVLEISVGPIMLDVALARTIGWDDAAIREAEIGIRLISRGASSGNDLRSKRVCEHCLAAKAAHPGVCSACGEGAPRRVDAPFGEDR